MTREAESAAMGPGSARRPRDPCELARRQQERLRILVVDDEPLNVRLLEKALAAAGFTAVKTTTDSRQFMSLFREFQPDLVLLDLMMPPPDGFTLMAQIRESQGSGEYLPILILTADASTGTRLRALAGGATEFLTKPFDLVEVELRIRTLLETRLLHLQLAGQNRLLEQRVRERTRQIEELSIVSIERLALIAEFRDDVTHEHTMRVGQSARLIALELGIDDEHAAVLRRAAPLHDIGKVGIPDRILLKPGPLTREEFSEMREHTEIGARIVGGSRSPVLELASEIALYHHERWDGTGYVGLKGVAIPMAARIVSVADVFDALVNARPYKPAWPADRALAEVTGQRGRQFDPDAVDAFLRVVERVGAAALAGGHLP